VGCFISCVRREHIRGDWCGKSYRREKKNDNSHDIVLSWEKRPIFKRDLRKKSRTGSVSMGGSGDALSALTYEHWPEGCSHSDLQK